jgi:hypothetical protein
MSPRLAAAVAAMNQSTRLRLEDYDRIAKEHGFDPDDNKLVHALVNEGWVYTGTIDPVWAYVRNAT